MSATLPEVSPPHARWDLSALFNSIDDPRIDQTWKDADSRATAFDEKFRGKIAHDDLTANTLLAAIQEVEALALDLAKPVTYANLLFAQDSSNPRHGAFLQSQMERGTGIQVKIMFFELELQSISESKISELLMDPALNPYEHFIHVTRTFSPYRLSEKEEVLLEEAANTGSRAWVRLFEELTSNHVYRLRRPGSDSAEELSQEEVLTMLRDGDRALRQAAADAFSVGLAELQRVICFAYNTLLQDKSVEDRLRKHPYPEHSRHLTNELPKETVDLVVGLCKRHEELVARYYRVKREILGLPELTHIDRYAPLFEAEELISYERAEKMVLDAFDSFSPIIKDKAAEFFSKSWIDAEPRPGKSGGAFCSYITPDTHPVILMSYLCKAGDVNTLAHELGHGVHASLSREQSYFNFHGTLPLAELSSIFGEMLVFEKLMESATTKDQLAMVADKCEGIFATVFRQAAMFRFEQNCHKARRERGELTPEEFGEAWQEEIQAMFGDSVKLGDQHKLWWSYVGHFFFAPFYVYAYSFGELLTLSLYQKAKVEGPEFAEKFVKVLRLGGSKSPQELMDIVGADLNSEPIWNGGFTAIDQMVGKFESLWNELKASS